VVWKKPGADSFCVLGHRIGSMGSLLISAGNDRKMEQQESPGKITLRNAQLIEKLFFGQYSIAYLMRGTMKSYGPAR